MNMNMPAISADRANAFADWLVDVALPGVNEIADEIYQEAHGNENSDEGTALSSITAWVEVEFFGEAVKVWISQETYEPKFEVNQICALLGVRNPRYAILVASGHGELTTLVTDSGAVTLADVSAVIGLAGVAAFQDLPAQPSGALQ